MNYKLIYPQNLSFKVKNPIHPKAHAALVWLEEQADAYAPGWVNPGKFGCLSRLLKTADNKYREFPVQYANPKYGLMRITGISSIFNYIPPHYYKQTYCTLGPACFLWFYTDMKGKKYKHVRGKHPIHLFCQSSANACARALNAGTKYPEWNFKKIPIEDLVYYTAQGDLCIAAWENPETYIGSDGEEHQRPGHVTTILGLGSGLMTYNIGSKNGYMTLKKAFGGTAGKDIKYYVLVRSGK